MATYFLYVCLLRPLDTNAPRLGHAERRPGGYVGVDLPPSRLGMGKAAGALRRKAAKRSGGAKVRQQLDTGGTCGVNESHVKEQIEGLPGYFMRHWQPRSVSFAQAQRTYAGLAGWGRTRFQIVGGKLYYPNLKHNTFGCVLRRTPILAWALLEMLERHPDTPDVDLPVNCRDKPGSQLSGARIPELAFSYTTGRAFSDVPLPDYTYWVRGAALGAHATLLALHASACGASCAGLAVRRPVSVARLAVAADERLGGKAGSDDLGRLAHQPAAPGLPPLRHRPLRRAPRAPHARQGADARARVALQAHRRAAHAGRPKLVASGSASATATLSAAAPSAFISEPITTEALAARAAAAALSRFLARPLLLRHLAPSRPLRLASLLALPASPSVAARGKGCPVKPKQWTPLEEQCKYRYILHLPGISDWLEHFKHQLAG
jgi:hypothetical protein